MSQFAVGRQSFLVVFDFDHTLIDCNSDEVIPTRLGRKVMMKSLMQSHNEIQWTRLIDTLIAPFTKEQINEVITCESIEIDPHMNDVLAYLQSIREANNYTNTINNNSELEHPMIPPYIEVDVASDANSFFVETILRKCLPAAFTPCPLITQIHSNSFTSLNPTTTSTTMTETTSQETYSTTLLKQENVNLETETLTTNKEKMCNQCNMDETERDKLHNNGHVRRCRLGWYEPHSHSCSLCNANSRPHMCKSRILHRILATSRLIDPTIIYIGDGLNDYCPVLNVLRPRDYVLVRSGYALHTLLFGHGANQTSCLDQQGHTTPLDRKTLSSMPGSRAGGCCGVGLWNNACELLQLLRAIVENKSVRLPTLVRFRDAGANEFRSITMNKRIPAVLKRTLEENEKHSVTPPLRSSEENNNNNNTNTNSKNNNIKANVSSLSRELVRALINDAQMNNAVPPLPGQVIVPAWLRNYAFTTEYDCFTDHIASRAFMLAGKFEHRRFGSNTNDNVVLLNAYQRIAPRWGQLPWLHGEIYFYHLLWQYLLLNDDTNVNGEENMNNITKNNNSKDNNINVCNRDVIGNADTDANKKYAVNMITPYIIENPLFSQACCVASTQGLVSASDVKHQSLQTDFLTQENVSSTHHIDDSVVVINLPAPSSVILNDDNSTDHDNNNNNNSDNIDNSKPRIELLTNAVNESRARYNDLIDPPGSGLLTIDHPSTFTPYRDIFHREKADLLLNFLELRVVPMLSCVPWEADIDFLPVLLRWMLWANGLDLSMFTLEQLSATHSHSQNNNKNNDNTSVKNISNLSSSVASSTSTSSSTSASASAVTKQTSNADNEASQIVRELREVEKIATLKQDNFLVANNSARVVKYVESLIDIAKAADQKTLLSAHATSDNKDVHGAKTHHETSLPTSFATVERRNICNHIDIVMDNVGVECIADFCFGLWFLEHASNITIPPTVTYHVKCMPYYVSDVTPRDVELLLHTLEQTYIAEDSERASNNELMTTSVHNNTSYNNTATDISTNENSNSSHTESEKDKKAMLRTILEPFVHNLRKAFASGAFLLDADTVWTQPSEYRDLPPRVINRYFYTQHVQHTTNNKTLPTPQTSAREWFVANKDVITPRSSLVIFKGDLNYRRLIGDRYWDRSDFLSTLVENCTDLHKAASQYTKEQQRIVQELLQDTSQSNVMDSPAFEEIVGAFWPTQHVPVCAIRTIKSECCVGVSGDVKQTLDQNGKSWRISGKYGEILFANESNKG